MIKNTGYVRISGENTENLRVQVAAAIAGERITGLEAEYSGNLPLQISEDTKFGDLVSGTRSSLHPVDVLFADGVLSISATAGYIMTARGLTYGA